MKRGDFEMAVIKFGTVIELQKNKGNMPDEIYKSALKIVERLDFHYGADRDLTDADGGYCLVVTTVQDVEFVNQHYINTASGRHEWAEIIKVKGSSPCVTAMFLQNNEHGIVVYFLNYGIVPRIILDEIERAEHE